MGGVSLFEPPISQIGAGLAMLVGLGAAVRGARQLARGVRTAASLDVVRGIRGFVIAIAAAAFAIGVLSGEAGFLVFGAIVLGEELYETGILAIIIRVGERSSAREGRAGVGGAPATPAWRRATARR
jgi:hypothetical protein